MIKNRFNMNGNEFLQRIDKCDQLEYGDGVIFDGQKLNV